MGDTSIKLAPMIFGADKVASDFIAEWNNDTDSITAHTSGSTGLPKVIKLQKEDMRTSALSTCEYFQIKPSSVLVSPLSANYIAGKMMLVRSFVSGAALWIEEPSNRPIIKNYGTIDLLPLVPSQVDWLIQNPSLFGSVKNIIIGGGALHPKMERQLINAPCNIFATYGMTETCSHIAFRNISTQEKCYTALPGISFDIDNRGCLIIIAPNFSFKRLITNDIIELKNSYQFIWKGRYDNVINTGGIKIYPEEVETRLATILDKPFYIIGRPNPKWGEEVVLYIECESIDVSQIINQARNLLMPYCVPKDVIIKPKFQRTESGKIKRILL